MANTRQTFIGIAQKEVGYKEGSKSNQTKYGAFFDANPPSGVWQFFNTKKNFVEWCSTFVHYCAVKAIGKEPTRLLFGEPKNDNCACGVPYFWNYLIAKGYKVDKKKGQAGDIIFFNSKKHVGLIEKIEGDKYCTIEGNKGNAVKRSSYKIGSTTIYGICHIPWEKYDKKEEEKPEPITKPSDKIEPIAVPSKPSAVSSKGKTMTVKVNTRLNVRSGAGTNYRIVRQLKNGAKVNVIEQRSGWGRIGKGEWVSMNYLH